MKGCLLFVLLFAFGFLRSYCQYDSLKPQGIYTSNFIIDETPRNLTYYMPANYGRFDSYPLLIFLHDEKSNATNVIKKYGDVLHKKADSLDCVVMYPDAITGHWNINRSGKDSINDISFISIMINFFVQQYHCDADRIYLAGIGTGGTMCYKVNCESLSKFKAAATINSFGNKNETQNCRKKESLPALNIKSEGNILSSINQAWNFLFSSHQNQ